MTSLAEGRLRTGSPQKTPLLPQLFLEAADVTLEAESTFKPLAQCLYANARMGLSGQQEVMACECHGEWDGEQNTACDEDLGCINRLTLIECTDECDGCGGGCQNQRFQKREYAPVLVIATEKKGFGLRADADIAAGTFVYEYIGEVIGEETFRKRMVQYDAEGIRHFYFMMLQKGEFIDATKKGALARFCNHLCRPNAYVDKWVVGKKLRMGIFAHRLILKGEEVTFNYNVDRYGAAAQPCYCGETNCIGEIGGKTQTDLALLLPDADARALGVTHEQERAWLKANKEAKKLQKLDSNVNEAFVRQLPVSPIVDAGQVGAVMLALMRSQEPVIISKLVERIDATSAEEVHVGLIRMHGYQAFARLLALCEEGEQDGAVVEHVLRVLLKWPRMTRNKISSSRIEDAVRRCDTAESLPEVRLLAQQLLSEWSLLEMAYRIPKRTSSQLDVYDDRRSDSKGSTPDVDPKNRLLYRGVPLPSGWECAVDENNGKVYFYNRATNETQWEVPSKTKKPKWENRGDRLPRSRERDQTIRDVKERQRLEREQMEAQRHKTKLAVEQAIQEAQRLAERAAERAAKQAKLLAVRSQPKPVRSQPKPVRPDNRWERHFAAVVPNMLRKHELQLGHEGLKKRAREIVHVLAAKEQKRRPGEAPPEAMSKEKMGKVKVFCDTYMGKYLQGKGSAE